jgi:ComF family protein
VLPQITDFTRTALDLLFPQWCIGCGRAGGYICPACRSSLSPIASPICPACENAAAAIDGIRAPFVFEGVLRRAVHEFKYRNLRDAAPMLAAMLADYLAANPLPADVLVPVPLHRRRLRERGYNQAGLLARQLGRLAGLPVVEDSLARRSYTPPQARAENIEARRQHVAGAFAADGNMAGRRVLLIDDVTTSGATLNAAAKALKDAGAASVWGLALAADI